jgi:hypothetical protein
MAKGGVRIPILSEFKPQGIDKAIKEFQKLEKTSEKIAFGLKKSFVPALAVTAGLAAGFVKLSLAAETAATSNARIVQITESMGLFGNETKAVTDRLIALAEATARNTGVDQNAIKETQAKLLTFKEIAATADEVGGSFDRATQAAIDLAAAGFGEATTNAVQLGKALNDPIKGITALTRSGVTFTKSEQDRIKVLVESNKVGEAQALILEAIESQVGGTAAATANASDKMAVSFSIMQEKLGTALLPIFEKFTAAAIVLFDFIGRNDKVFLAVAAGVGVLAGAIVAANIAMKVHAGLQTIVKVANATLGTSFQLTAVKMAKFTGGLALVGGAIAAGMFVYGLYRKEKERLVQLTQTFTSALEAERDGQEGATTAAIGAILASEKMQDRMSKLGLTSTDVAKAIRGEASPAFDDLAEKMQSVKERGIAADEQQRRLKETFGDSQFAAIGLLNEVNRLSKSYETAASQIDLTERVTSELEASTKTATSTTQNFDAASKALGDSMAAAEQAMARYEGSTRAADDALMKMIDTTLALFNADLGLQNQIARTEDAVWDYNAAVADGTLKGRDLEKAQRDVKNEALRQAAAAVQAAEAQAELAGKSLDASERQKILVDNLAAVARSLAPGDPLRAQLAAYITELRAVPGDVVTRFTTIRQEVIQQSTAAGFAPFFPVVTAAKLETPRQSRNIGGPVFGLPNRAVPITAHGGEYVLSSDVVSAIKRGAPSRGLGRGGAAGGGGGNVINVTVTSADPQAVVEAIRRYNRTNGPAPFRVAS